MSQIAQQKMQAGGLWIKNLWLDTSEWSNAQSFWVMFRFNLHLQQNFWAAVYLLNHFLFRCFLSFWHLIFHCTESRMLLSNLYKFVSTILVDILSWRSSNVLDLQVRVAVLRPAETSCCLKCRIYSSGSRRSLKGEECDFKWLWTQNEWSHWIYFWYSLLS